MAKEDDDSIAIQIDDLDTVNVPVDDEVKLAGEPEHIKKEATKEKKPRRVVPDENIQVATGHEEAIAEAKAYAKQQEDARKAAEATAASERAMREQAQREAQQAQHAAQELEQRANNSELAILENGIAAANREIEALEGEYTRAAEAGEFAKMGTIQTKLSRAAARLDRFENEKATFEASGRRTPTAEGRVEAPPVVQSNPVEQYLSQFTPAAQSWLRQHPECYPPNIGGDVTKNSKMMAGHWDAVGKSVALNSPEYFRIIEEHITGVPAVAPAALPTQQSGITSKAAEVQTAEAPRAPKHIQPAAPVTRDPPASNGQPRSSREVRLTKEQQEMAKVSFPHLPEQQAFGQYARNLIELEAEGKIGRLTH
jgi:hypothetical protein